MINEIAMALMFAALFILVLAAVIVGSRVGKAETRPPPEKAEEPPKEEAPKTQEPPPEKTSPIETGRPLDLGEVYEEEPVEVYEEEPSLYMPEPEYFINEPVEAPDLGLDPPGEEAFIEPAVDLTDPEPTPELDQGGPRMPDPEAVSPEPLREEGHGINEPYEDTYREPDYFRDEDVSPVQGVTTCPHCGEKVPSTLYCINCGKSLNE